MTLSGSQNSAAPPLDLLGKQHTCDPAMLNRWISPLLLHVHLHVHHMTNLNFAYLT